MTIQLLKVIIQIFCLLVLFSGALHVWWFKQDQPQQFAAAMLYAKAHTFYFYKKDESPISFTDSYGRPGTISLGTVKNSPGFIDAGGRLTQSAVEGVFNGIWVGFGIVALIVVLFWLKGSLVVRAKRIKGAQLISVKELKNLTTPDFFSSWRVKASLTASAIFGLLTVFVSILGIGADWVATTALATSAAFGLLTGYFAIKDRKISKTSPYSLAGVPWLKDEERLHTLIVGSTGTGKTVCISDLLDQVEAQNDKAIVYDKLGSFIPHFYKPERDIILNPFDERSADWCLFKEAQTETDFHTMAAALIPDFKDTADPFWSMAARSLFAFSASSLWKKGNHDMEHLLNLLLRIDMKNLAEIVEGTEMQSIITKEQSKTALSVRTVLSTYMQALTLSPPVKKPFSVREWVQDKSKTGFLFLSSHTASHEARRSLISTQIELAIIAKLSMSKVNPQPMWLILDELPTLQKVPALTSGLRESRQFGMGIVLGTQVFSEMRDLYGRETAATISGNCNTRLSLASPDRETAQWMSDNLGREVTERMNEGISYGASEIRDGVSQTKREETTPIILPSDIMNLERLEGYLKMPFNLPAAKIKLKPRNRTVIAEAFVPLKKTPTSTPPSEEAPPPSPPENTAPIPIGMDDREHPPIDTYDQGPMSVANGATETENNEEPSATAKEKQGSKKRKSAKKSAPTEMGERQEPPLTVDAGGATSAGDEPNEAKNQATPPLQAADDLGTSDDELMSGATIAKKPSTAKPKKEKKSASKKASTKTATPKEKTTAPADTASAKAKKEKKASTTDSAPKNAKKGKKINEPASEKAASTKEKTTATTAAQKKKIIKGLEKHHPEAHAAQKPHTKTTPPPVKDAQTSEKQPESPTLL